MVQWTRVRQRAQIISDRRPRYVSVLITIGLNVCFWGCSWGPIRDITSLSPGIEASAVGYNDAVADAADQILISNILRSEDLKPLSLSQLSSISGALSASGSVGFTIPFGHPGLMGSGEVKGQDSASPSVSAGTSPTFTFTPLNTQSFMLNIVQPIFGNYVINLLEQGIPREILLTLFIKEIDFPREDRSLPYRYINNPDDREHFAAFQKLLAGLIRSNAFLKAVDVLEPVGPQFNFYAATSNPSNQTTMTYNKFNPSTGTFTPTATPQDYNQSVQAYTPTAFQTNVDQSGFGLITSANDAQYHVGNSSRNLGQLFRVYAGQVVLCIDSPTIEGHPVPPLDWPDKGRRSDAPLGQTIGATNDARRIHLASLASDPTVSIGSRRMHGVFDIAQNQPVMPFAGGSPPSGASPSGSTGGGPKGGGGSPSTSGSGGAGQATTPPLQAARISTLVFGDTCRRDQVILNGFSDDKFGAASKSFVHVYWRSVKDIFDFLGAVLRYNKREGKPITIPVLADSTIAGSSAQVTPVFFALYENQPGLLRVIYNEHEYTVADLDPKSPKGDYSRRILSILSDLVNYASQSSAAATSTPLRLLPLP